MDEGNWYGALNSYLGCLKSIVNDKIETGAVSEDRLWLLFLHKMNILPQFIRWKVIGLP